MNTLEPTTDIPPVQEEQEPGQDGPAKDRPGDRELFTSESSPSEQNRTSQSGAPEADGCRPHSVRTQQFDKDGRKTDAECSHDQDYNR